MTKVLVIDDERPIRSALKEILEYEKYKVDEAENGKEGLDKITKNKYDIVLCDIKMPGLDGIELVEEAMKANVKTPIVMISGHGNVETAVEALKKGAYDFIEKPLDLNRILVTIRNATEKSELVKETTVLKRRIKHQKDIDIIGESDSINAIKEIINKVAPKDARVLITGQNGTGKELVARQIHELSERNKASFIEVNCAAIPSELIESELFGHEKGAFTSANKLRKGKFEQAQGGTIFLDEIGDMSLSAQAKVLRALQEKKITRVGSEKDINVDVRVLAATNKDLKKEISENKFREDLYHRLAVILIEVPRLSDRKSDIPLLVEHFNQAICQEQGIAPRNFDETAIKKLQEHSWTGNIRELRNVIERLIILCDKDINDHDVKTYVHIE